MNERTRDLYYYLSNVAVEFRPLLFEAQERRLNSCSECNGLGFFLQDEKRVNCSRCSRLKMDFDSERLRELQKEIITAETQLKIAKQINLNLKGHWVQVTKSRKARIGEIGQVTSHNQNFHQVRVRFRDGRENSLADGNVQPIDLHPLPMFVPFAPTGFMPSSSPPGNYTTRVFVPRDPVPYYVAYVGELAVYLRPDSKVGSRWGFRDDLLTPVGAWA